MTLEAEPELEQEPEPEPEPEPEERRGIPGFPLASTIVGLMTGIALIWLIQER